ncbi:MAG TPA: hypothetical protein VMA54_04705 [Steroidobacteraceae bacterium]|nr:hypothetical protein [Steroidobacteraceae bacterium]
MLDAPNLQRELPAGVALKAHSGVEKWRGDLWMDHFRAFPQLPHF